MKGCKGKICHIANIDMAVKFLLLNQLKFLKNEGYEVYVVCSAGPLIDDIKNHGIKVKTINFNRGLNPAAHFISLFKLFFYLRKEKFDIVHTHTPVPGLLGQLSAKAAMIPIVVNTIHGFYFTESSSFLKRTFFILIEKIAASCSDLIFSQNKEDIKTAIKENISSPSKIKYLGNGVDIRRFNPERFSREFINRKKKELNLNPNFRVVGTVGRLVREKGYLELFEAFEKVLRKFPETALLVIGPEEPSKKDKINRNTVKNYGIEKKVLFLGQRTNVDELYPLIDIFILPSWREGFPRTIIEASAAGKPVITTDIRGCREAIGEKAGILIPVRDPEKIKEKVVYLFENPEIARKMGKEGRKRAEKEFDEREIFSRIKTEYQRLLGEKKIVK